MYSKKNNNSTGRSVYYGKPSQNPITVKAPAPSYPPPPPYYGGTMYAPSAPSEEVRPQCGEGARDRSAPDIASLPNGTAERAEQNMSEVPFVPLCEQCDDVPLYVRPDRVSTQSPLRLTKQKPSRHGVAGNGIFGDLLTAMQSIGQQMKSEDLLLWAVVILLLSQGGDELSILALLWLIFG